MKRNNTDSIDGSDKEKIYDLRISYLEDHFNNETKEELDDPFAKYLNRNVHRADCAKSTTNLHGRG